MAGSELRALAIAVVMIAASGCGTQPDRSTQSSVTVKLPVARPHTPAPAFSFKPRKRSGAEVSGNQQFTMQ